MTEHLKMPAVPPRVQYVADGATIRFAFPFPIFAAGDLAVFLDAAPQTQGFVVTGAGRTEGGALTFDTAPAAGTVVTLERRLVLERLTDFRESGPLSARTLNEHLDRVTAGLQQVANDQALMLRFPETDLPAAGLLPGRAARAGRVLGFDGAGNPIALPPAETGSTTPFSQSGPGAIPRSVRDKLADIASVKDFGAVGDGVVDDTLAIQAALAAHRAVFLPEGAYRISGTLTLGYGQTLFGVGEASVVQARQAPFDAVNFPDYPSQFNAIELVEGYATVRDLRIVGGASGIKLYGRDGPCVKNVVENVSIWDTIVGIVLDGYADTDRPCYWNNISRVLCARQQLHGVLLTVESSGDTPNANKFHDVRVYSIGAPISGCGFFVSAGKYNNSFVDCEANLHPGGEACFRLGAASEQTLIVNFYAESHGALPGIRIDNGSTATGIVNLFSATAGQPIWDTTGARAYTAVNAGFPIRNLLKETQITDLRVEGFAVDTDYVELPSGGLVVPDLKSTTYLISAFGGGTEFRLPDAEAANGRIVTVKKLDASANPVRITQDGGDGPDGREIVLANRFDFVTVVSNGAGWWITATNLAPANAWFHEGEGVFIPDLTRSLHLVSAAAGPVEVRLPGPATPQAVGRQVTIKKSDPGPDPVTVTQDGATQDGATGPEGRVWLLGGQYDFVTVFSNGAGWWVTGGNGLPEATVFHEAPGIFAPDLRAALYLVSAFVGTLEVRLPAPSAANAGRRLTIKRVDGAANSLTVTVAGTPDPTGPDGGTLTLSGQHAAATLMSNGAAWHVLSRHAP